MRKFLCVVVVITTGFGFFPAAAKGEDAMETMHLVSSAFSEGGTIPKKYTCDGEDVSPPLRWSGVPAGTQSFALIMDDPDAPMGTWVHWVLYDLPPKIDMLPEAIPAIKKLANAEKQGVNSSGRIGYQGPCPPSGSHRYYFKLYALDTVLGLDSGLTKDALVKAMKGHVLSEGGLMGRCARKS